MGEGRREMYTYSNNEKSEERLSSAQKLEVPERLKADGTGQKGKLKLTVQVRHQAVHSGNIRSAYCS